MGGAQAPAAQRCASACHYRVLGLGAACSKKEVKAAYRSLARRLHPDALPAARAATGAAPASPAELEATARHFQAVREAYECLADDSRRRSYDSSRGLAAGGGTSPPDRCTSSTQPRWPQPPQQRPMAPHVRRPAAGAASPPPRQCPSTAAVPQRPAPSATLRATGCTMVGRGSCGGGEEPGTARGATDASGEQWCDRLMEVLRHQGGCSPKARPRQAARS